MKIGARGTRLLAVLAAALLLVVTADAAQFGRGQRGGGRIGGRGAPLWDRFATFDDFDGSFQFCRLEFRNSTNGDGDGWGVDWPRADQNLSIRVSELTRMPVSLDATDTPKTVLLTATMPELSRCPFVMMT